MDWTISRREMIDAYIFTVICVDI